jgi:gamma-carbonic anhydrase
VRKLDPQELKSMHRALRDETAANGATVNGPLDLDTQGLHFIAETATLRGKVALAENVGVWFGCALYGNALGISVGDRTNIQDNTTVRSIDRSVEIGEEATIGHNVTMSDCIVMSRSLVGMGATVSPGTIIHEDVLLAAGAATQAGQVLESGWLYGGSPARKLSRLDDEKRAIITSTWPVYMEYARHFDREQNVKRTV